MFGARSWLWLTFMTLMFGLPRPLSFRLTSGGVAKEIHDPLLHTMRPAVPKVVSSVLVQSIMQIAASFGEAGIYVDFEPILKDGGSVSGGFAGWNVAIFYVFIDVLLNFG